MKYRVTFNATETYDFDVVVEADSEDDARVKARDYDMIERKHHEQYDEEITLIKEVK